MEPITYKQAAELLGVSQSTIHNAVARGDLIKYPKPGQTQHLIKEQVLLFTKPKIRLAVRFLSAEKRKQWQVYADNSTQPQSQAASTNKIPAFLSQFDTPEIKAGLGVVATLGLVELVRHGEITPEHFMKALATQK